MKKTLFTILALLMMGRVSADVTISVDDITLPQNGKAELAVKFVADGGETFQGYNIDIQLPAGMSLETNSKGEIIYASGNCYGINTDGNYKEVEITVNLDEGLYKMSYSRSTPLEGTSGTLVTFNLVCDDELPVGNEYNGVFVKAQISGENGLLIGVDEGSNFPNSQIIANDFTITIGEPLTTVELDEDSEVAPVASDGKVNVHVQRTINANEWSTICLPFAMTAAQVKEAFGDEVKLGDFDTYAFTAASGDNTVNHITVNFKSVTSMEANHPYIIRVENTIEEFTTQNVSITPAQPIKVYGYTTPVVIEYGKFVGTYTANFDFYHAAMINDWVYPPLFLSGNKFWYASENTQPMKAFRAYLTFKYHYAPDMDPAETRVDLNFNDGEATGISSVQTLAADGLYYNLNGQAVERPAKGLYIHNGKKVILK